MENHRSSIGRDILVSAGAGLLGNLVAGRVDRFLSRRVSADQRRRELAVRDASAHEMAARKLAAKFGGPEPDERAERLGRAAFAVAYGTGWGIVYALARRAWPRAAQAAGAPFGVAFFFLCDGLIAPKVRLSPPLRRIPWQPNAKEMLNHLAWTATAELTHRAASR